MAFKQCQIFENGVRCGEKVRARGMCIKHWQRWDKHGDPLKGAMPKRPEFCEVVEDGVVCGAPHESRGMCAKHAKRDREYGDPLYTKNKMSTQPRQHHFPGEVYGELTLIEYFSDSRKWLCLCSCGQTKLAQIGGTKTCGNRTAHFIGTDHWSWTEEPSYNALHRRLRRELGPASEQSCVDCGGQAVDHSYVGGCSAELTSEHEESLGYVYCVHPDCYVPRCKSCHEAYDKAHRMEHYK